MTENQKKPKIAVIIPAFNAELFIARAIDSVLAQTLTPDQIIVINDGSEDNTEKVIKENYPNINYIRQQNAGASAARNNGISRADCQLIAFLDADDLWHPGHLQQLLAVLNQHPDVKWAMANYNRVSRNNKKAALNHAHLKNPYYQNGIFTDFFKAQLKKSIIPLCTSTTIAAKQVFDKAGFFDQSIHWAEDTDMWLRIAYHYPKLAYNPNPTADVCLDQGDTRIAMRRAASKTSVPVTNLVKRHLKISQQHSRQADFEPFAKRLLAKTLKTTLYNANKSDTLALIETFPAMFSTAVKLLARALTHAPLLTARTMRLITTVKKSLHLAAPSKKSPPLKH